MKLAMTLLLFCLTIFSGANKAKDVVLPGTYNEGYFVTILSHALSYTPNKNYRLRFFGPDIPRLRILKLISENEGIDVTAAGATVERENILLPIRFPLLKGLLGWRISLVLSKNKTLFLDNPSIEEFKSLVPGQKFSWSDIRVLESNGINVAKGNSYESLFDMLEEDRFDYFPRSVIEIGLEYEKNKERGIEVEQNVLIHYPTAFYFYVNKENIELANDISMGLEQSLKDGSFEKLFMENYGHIIKKVQSENRKVYHLSNPFLPEKTPLHRKNLWLEL